MEINEYKDFADKCFRDTPPPCASVCPLSCDVREFIKQMQRGSYRNAYRVYKNKVIFPTIVSRLCPGKCVSACVRERNAGDKGVDLRALEQLCVDRMAGKKTDRFAVPKKTKQVAVIGGGMSGLACAYRMASYGYAVSVYEKTGLLGGTAGAQLGAEWCDAEIRREFAAVDCSIFLDNQVLELGEIQADAYYIATGADGWDFPGEQNNIFRGGALVGADKIDAIAQGIAAASAIEVFFSTGEREVIPLSFSESPDERYYRLNYDFIVKEDPSGKGAPEALRCMRCNCSACYDICPLMEKEKRFPWKMCTEIPVTLKPFMTNRSGVRMIMGCTDCKRCRDVCPEHIDMGKCLGDARVDFYETGAMSPAFHDFWLQDMEFSQSEEAYLLWKPDKEKKSDVLFFPGCQLGASLPDYVEKAYAAVSRISMNAAILLGCCGVPARWAGQEKTAQEAVKRIRSEWEKLGKPLFVTACPTCLKNLRQSLPEAETVSLYSWFAEHPEAFPNSVKEGESVYVLDPCASAEDPSVQESVRRLLGISGYRVKNKTADVGCCGFGGHIYSSVPALYHEFARRRLKDREGITVSYCVNCRDVFAEKGADSRHILSLLFDIPDERRLPPELDMRRENRRQLKGYFTGEKRMSVRSPYNIVIPMEIMKKMDKKMILREQIEKIITESEQTGRKIADDENALFYAHRVFGAVTIWAVYMRNEDTIEVTNVYVHRVKIGESQDAVL